MVTASVKSGLRRFRDSLIAIPGTLFFSLVAFLFDVVVNGCPGLSMFVCPILILVGVVRHIRGRARGGVAAAGILVPVVALLLGVANYYLQADIAMANAARVIEACERYRQSNGTYPQQLDDLVPRYLCSVPKAKYCLSYSQFEYQASSTHTLVWYYLPPFGRYVYIFEDNLWRVVD